MLKAKDICAIIRACGEAGVSKLKLADFEVSFKADQKALYSQEPQSQLEDQQIPFTTTSGSTTAAEHQLEFPFEGDELRLKEDRIALMQIEDPVSYEQLLASGDLEDGETARPRRA